jgi:hypothetical protein
MSRRHAPPDEIIGECKMGMLKFRADKRETNADGSVSWFADWMGGPSLAKIEKCRTDLAGEPRVTAFIQGEADTFFSIPAVCSYRGCRVLGYVTRDESGPLFRVCYY